MFNVKLEAFDAASKPKVIREVKALIPNLNLMDVSASNMASIYAHVPLGQKVRRVPSPGPQGELVKGRCRKTPKGIRGHWS